MAFSYEECRASVLAFAEEAPKLLSRHAETAALGLQVSRLDLPSALTTRFTVAVIGQMRAGKSTLINALIGRRLAPVGVTETTATLNWFRHGVGETCDAFRVRWKDGSDEALSLDRVEEWLGLAENARRTRGLDFFADTPFLLAANLVDTPGTRSVIESHGKTLQAFLAEELETETLRQGGRADAVVYVVNPVAREADTDLLALFGEKTRLPGASAYNSIAVMQKWEALGQPKLGQPGPGLDPVLEAERMCDRIRSQLEGKVAEVVPASGMLALAVAEAPAALWEGLSHLAEASSQAGLTSLLLSQETFTGDAEGVPLSCEERRTLLDQAPTPAWPTVRFALRLARIRGIADGGALRRAVYEASGVDRLRHTIEVRFLSLAGLIQAGTALRKAREPCRSALTLLSQEIRELEELRHDGAAALKTLQPAATRNPSLAPVLGYVRRSLVRSDNEAVRLAETRAALDRLLEREERTFRLLDADLECLRRLEVLVEADEIGEAEAAELRRLFGQGGPSIAERLRLTLDTSAEDTARVAAERHGAWAARRFRSGGVLRIVCEHAVDRLDAILDRVEGVDA